MEYFCQKIDESTWRHLLPITVTPMALLATAELLITIAQFYPDFILDNYIWIKLIRRWTDLILISNYSNPNGLNGNTRIAQNPEIQNGGGVHSRENTLSRDVHHITVSNIKKYAYIWSKIIIYRVAHQYCPGGNRPETPCNPRYSVAGSPGGNRP